MCDSSSGEEYWEVVPQYQWLVPLTVDLLKKIERESEATELESGPAGDSQVLASGGFGICLEAHLPPADTSCQPELGVRRSTEAHLPPSGEFRSKRSLGALIMATEDKISQVQELQPTQCALLCGKRRRRFVGVRVCLWRRPVMHAPFSPQLEDVNESTVVVVVVVVVLNFFP